MNIYKTIIEAKKHRLAFNEDMGDHVERVEIGGRTYDFEFKAETVTITVIGKTKNLQLFDGQRFTSASRDQHTVMNFLGNLSDKLALISTEVEETDEDLFYLSEEILEEEEHECEPPDTI